MLGVLKGRFPLPSLPPPPPKLDETLDIYTQHPSTMLLACELLDCSRLKNFRYYIIIDCIGYVAMIIKLHTKDISYASCISK